MADIDEYYERTIGEAVKIALDVVDGNLDEVSQVTSQLRRVKNRPVSTSQQFIGEPVDAQPIPMTIGSGFIFTVEDSSEMTPGWWLQDARMLISGSPYTTPPIAIYMVPGVTGLEL